MISKSNNASTINIMFRLVGLVKPLALVMVIAIFMGCLGYLCATFLSVLGTYVVLGIIQGNAIGSLLYVILFIALMRGILHYIEQYCNHYIAFKLLAIIRDKVFTSLIRLTPAKLDGADKGNLISLITSDIELLEVFYAHTLSPICIAIITSSIVVIFLSQYHIGLALVLLIAHIWVGIINPYIASKRSKQNAQSFRENNGMLHTYFLDSLRGIKEVSQYHAQQLRKDHIVELSNAMEEKNKQLKQQAAFTYLMSNSAILISTLVMLLVAIGLYINSYISVEAIYISIVLIISSFGAVIPLSNLGVGLSQTIACGKRVLDILDEQPVVEDIIEGVDVEFLSASLKDVDFAYDTKNILENYSLDIPKDTIIGIHGKSGTGKSTTLKLLMRFFDVQKGNIYISNKNVKDINTSSLRSNQSYVTQETHLFNDTIENNIKLANLNASHEEVVEACKKASIHTLIMSLSNGYDSHAGELGSFLSGGEKQRIGVARAFLHKSPLILLDEPTSNLDSLNEAIILKSLKEEKNKTIVLVTHRLSTLRIADKIIAFESERKS